MLRAVLAGLSPVVALRRPVPVLRSFCAGAGGSSSADGADASSEVEQPEWVEAYNRALAAIEANKGGGSATAGGQGEDGLPLPLGAGGSERMRNVDVHGRAYGTGRRKRSTARVWIQEGEGKFVINKRPATEYMSDRQSWLDHMAMPLQATGRAGRFDVVCTTSGGGHTGQAGAIRLGISRALQNFEPNLRPQLKREGLLTRDARKVERKKPGKKKARKSFQWVKR